MRLNWNGHGQRIIGTIVLRWTRLSGYTHYEVTSMMTNKLLLSFFVEDWPLE